MEVLEKLLKSPNRRVAVIMALIGTVTPLGGIHKFYVGQPLWGVIYLLLWSTPMPKIACAIEAVWYALQDRDEFELRFNRSLNRQRQQATNLGGFNFTEVGAMAEALRQLDRLRADGLISEYEFEQKRRQLLDRA